ncbi:hypothetical protein TNCV_2607211 [Trichonephila clavipes]|uniref:Uncharacterized protein n=1 Tax=Trichonephila clavipes TaxID=2585209 RepID=A0A8X6V1X9_TRICX|nr:hypothetical protein TNCV_2607211 [Trichonephila clavipes]
MRNRMLPVLCGPSLVRKMFGCCPDLHVHQIFHQSKTSGLWFPSVWLVTIRVTTVDEWWYRVKAVWLSVPVHAIQSLFDLIPRRHYQLNQLL